MGYNPEVEVNYYKGIQRESRLSTLVEQQTTAVAESVLKSFARRYQWDRGEVRDGVSGELLRDLVARGGNNAEILAWAGIEGGLTEEEVTIVNFSPQNLDINYPENVIDLWRRTKGCVEWTRITVCEGVEKFGQVFKELTGEIISDELEILSKPIKVDRTTLNNLLSKFTAIKDGVKTNIHEIRNTVKTIVDDFVRKFGEDFVLNEEKILRSFSAAMDSVKKSKLTKTLLDIYSSKPMLMRIVQTFGCSVQTVVGQFIENITALPAFKEKYFECPKCKGKIESGKGIETCPHCGMTKQEAGSVCD